MAIRRHFTETVSPTPADRDASWKRFPRKCRYLALQKSRATVPPARAQLPISYASKRMDPTSCNAPMCGLGRAETSYFDPSTYYTADYFSGGHADGYSDYRGAEAVLRREFAGTVDFIRGFRSGGKLLEVGCAYGFFSRRRAVISKLPASNWPMTQPLIVAVKDCTCYRASPMKPTLDKLVAWT